jgi:hypothetical protein
LAGSGAEFPDPLLRQIATSNWDDFHNKVRAGTVAVLSLALGIGANTVIFSLVDIILLRPLRYAHSEPLVSVGLSVPQFGATHGVMSAVPAQAAEKQNDHMEGVHSPAPGRSCWHGLLNGQSCDLARTGDVRGCFSFIWRAGESPSPASPHGRVAGYLLHPILVRSTGVI